MCTDHFRRIAGDIDVPSSLGEGAGNEIEYLWSDLERAIRRACNGHWSAECDYLTERIIMLSSLVGAAPWEKIPLSLLRNGIYQGIMTAAGLEYAPPDMEEVARISAIISGGGDVGKSKGDGGQIHKPNAGDCGGKCTNGSCERCGADSIPASNIKSTKSK